MVEVFVASAPKELSSIGPPERRREVAVDQLEAESIVPLLTAGVENVVHLEMFQRRRPRRRRRGTRRLQRNRRAASSRQVVTG